MTHTYKLTGMTCGSCETKVKSSLITIPGITEAEVSKEHQTAVISMSRQISLPTMQSALDKKYTITAEDYDSGAEKTKSWLSTYKPVLIIFLYAIGLAIMLSIKGSQFHVMQAMNIFMSGFFLTFSFFKMLDLKGFSESYAMYDIVAMKIPAWGYVYPFIELALGIAFALNFKPILTNIITLTVTGISIIGVLQSVFNKKKIKCACLGSVFNLPMSTVTIIEDGLMIAMSAAMIIMINR